MIDFGLKPCPLCGGEPEVARLTQGPEELTAVIKCTSCGLTLEWDTEIKVGVSRSGKRTPVKAGLDPIEAWNRRRMCDNCGDHLLAEQVCKMHDCNTCRKTSCVYKPKPGEQTRLNCPVWLPMEETP
jgi:hypothetical protein